MKIDIDDLYKIKGIGSKTIERIKTKFQNETKTNEINMIKKFSPITIGDIRLYNGDCLEVMDYLIDNKIIVDSVICDPPYGTTACKWDFVIPFKQMWERLDKILKKNGAVVLFGSEPFSSNLRLSNIYNYKYDWIWKKTKPSGFQHSKNRPMRIVENICVFSNSPMGHKSQLGDKRMNYFPQGLIENGIKKVRECTHRGNTMGGDGSKSSRPNQVGKEYISYRNFPNDCLEYPNIQPNISIHPTQKPVDLMEYLVKTYTNENETILDFTMGSGSTGVACFNTNRKFIGIEKDEKIFDIQLNRIKQLKQ